MEAAAGSVGKAGLQVMRGGWDGSMTVENLYVAGVAAMSCSGRCDVGEVKRLCVHATKAARLDYKYKVRGQRYHN